MITYFIYDGSFDGFLSAIFEGYERKLRDITFLRAHQYQPKLDGTYVQIQTDQSRSQRVWTGLKKKLSRAKLEEVYKTFLSELPQMEILLYNFFKDVFSSGTNIENDLANPQVIGVTRIARQVHREKHRMEAFTRFQRTREDLYFATINPDFNILPLIASHFKDRYADQNWLICDRKRMYGISYDRGSAALTEVQVDLHAESAAAFLPEHLCHEDELPWQKLWREYFSSVNIAARKNTTLHVRHVPKRYWEYLTEKRNFL